MRVVVNPTSFPCPLEGYRKGNSVYHPVCRGSAGLWEVSASQTDSDKMVCLVIPEPLPGLKEQTGTVEEHWTRTIHEAIAMQAKTGIPCFEKAHVHIRIPAPRGTNNRKGIFFDNDDFEHMSCSIEASWGKIGMTVIRICDHKELKRVTIFASD